MTGASEISKEEFLELPAEEIRRIVLEKKMPRVGIFVADGNRRLVMCKTHHYPTSRGFYREYARFFTDSLRKALTIFFDHGLETLFFPLFGPSLLLRKNEFQTTTIPIAYRKIFQSDEFLQFYREKDIRVKAYGDLSQLEKIDVKNLNMAEGIRETAEKTAGCKKHTVFFGFMSEYTPGLEMPKLIIDFYKSNNRQPLPREMLEIYYGEKVPAANFLLFSNKFATPGAIPPMVCTSGTKMYYFPVPGFLAFDTISYRKILYDLIFIQPGYSHAQYTEEDLTYIESLENFYERNKNTIVGIGEKLGQFLVTDIHKDMGRLPK